MTTMTEVGDRPAFFFSSPLQLLLLTIAATAAAFSLTAVGPLQETMRIALSASDNQMALLQGPALALPVVISSIPLGLAVDRYSRVYLLLIFAVLSVIGSAVTALAPSFAVLFFARVLVGLAAAATAVTAYSLVADLCPPTQRGRASTVVAVGQYGGIAASFALGGALLAMSGSRPDGWRWAMLWMTAPMVLGIFAILALREPPRTGVALRNPPTRGTYVELWRYRGVIVPLVAGVTMAYVAMFGVLTWTAPTFARSFALPPDRIGAITGTALLVSGILGPIIGGPLADICQRTGGPRKTIAALSGLALLGAPAGLFAVMPGTRLASVLLVIFLAILYAMPVTLVALLTIVIPNKVLGLCLAISTAAAMLFGVGLAPMTVSWLSGALGGLAMIGKALALVCVTSSLLGAAMFAIGRRYFPARRDLNC